MVLPTSLKGEQDDQLQLQPIPPPPQHGQLLSTAPNHSRPQHINPSQDDPWLSRQHVHHGTLDSAGKRGPVRALSAAEGAFSPRVQREGQTPRSVVNTTHLRTLIRLPIPGTSTQRGDPMLPGKRDQESSCHSLKVHT